MQFADVDVNALIDELVSHASSRGYFDSVNTHEPKSAPGIGLVAAIWVQGCGPAIGASSLGSTTLRLEFRLRMYKPFQAAPSDMIDPDMTTAVMDLMAAYSGAFTLGGEVRDIDLLGAHGTPLSWLAGYLSIDKSIYRIIDLTIPLIINDVLTQGA